MTSCRGWKSCRWRCAPPPPPPPSRNDADAPAARPGARRRDVAPQSRGLDPRRPRARGRRRGYDRRERRPGAAARDGGRAAGAPGTRRLACAQQARGLRGEPERPRGARSEEHTSELQSLAYLVCRLLLEKKKKTTRPEVPVPARDDPHVPASIQRAFTPRVNATRHSPATSQELMFPEARPGPSGRASAP